MAPILRIFLRYLSGVLIAKGVIGDGDASLFEDPELVTSLEAGAGLLIGAGTEYWYKMARKFGWEK